jgi:acetyltransferase EpsM
MAELSPILIPLLNPNEPEALLVSLEVPEGSSVNTGQVIAVIETTKSTGEILAESDGTLVGLRFKPGDTLTAGEVLAYIGESPDAADPTLPPWSDDADQASATNWPTDLRITEPARQLAIEKGIELDTLPRGILITRQVLTEKIASSAAPVTQPETEADKRLVIYGAGGHGRSLAALIQTLGAYEIIGFIDDGYPPDEVVFGLPLLGNNHHLEELVDDGIQLAANGVGGIGDLKSRLNVYRLLNQAGLYCPTLVHPTAFVETSAELSDGIQVYPQAYIGTEVQIGYGCIVNTGTIVSHNCRLAAYVNLSPGATLAGDVQVGEGALVGMRATINLGIRIGERALIGNGATVKADVPDGGVVPAGTIWPPRS